VTRAQPAERSRSLGKTLLEEHSRSSGLACALLLLLGMDALRAIQESVEFIESHLDELPQVPEIARKAGLSTAHFQRLFHALVGETVVGYARRRRLSRSVEALIETDQRVLDIALEAGFESQEAFTRAFAQQFGIPPGRFRARGERAPGLALPAITRERLETRRRLEGTAPRIVEQAACDYVGVQTRFLSLLSDDSESREVVPALWLDFLERRDEITAAGEDDYGLCFPSDIPERMDELVYLAGTRVTRLEEVPAGMAHRRVPATRYAVFEHPGAATSLPDTILYTLLDWLPSSAFEYGGGVEIDFHPGDRSRHFEYWLPIEESP